MRVIHVLRKPLSEGTVAANTLKHGTGGLNIDASRISTDDNLNGGAYAENPTERWDGAENWRYKRGEQGNAGDYQQPSGRWPANVILQHLDGCRCGGVKRVKGSSCRSDHIGKGREGDHTNGIYGAKASKITTAYVDSDGKETVANWVCEPGCPVERLDEQSGVTKSTGGRIGNAQGVYTNQGRTGWGTGHEAGDPGFGDTGGASRFYKQVGGKTNG